MSDDIFDFGFTVVDESELEAVKKTQDTANDAEQLATTTQDRLDNYIMQLHHYLIILRKIQRKNISSGQIELIKLNSLKIC